MAELPKCTAVSAPANGAVQGTSLFIGSSRTFTCSSGYQLQGEATIKCEADGSGGAKWSHAVPTCSMSTNNTLCDFFITFIKAALLVE